MTEASWFTGMPLTDRYSVLGEALAGHSGWDWFQDVAVNYHDNTMDVRLSVNGKPVVLKDPLDQFPSDELLSKILLLVG